MSVLGDRIREEREWLGASREHVAEKLGGLAADVEAWEAAERTPTDAQVQRLARLFCLPVERLRGAPLVEDPVLAAVLGGRDLCHEDRYEVTRFAEYLRHRSEATA